MFFILNKTYIEVPKGIVYNDGVAGRSIFDKGDIPMQELEELFLLEYPDFEKI